MKTLHPKANKTEGAKKKIKYLRPKLEKIEGVGLGTFECIMGSMAGPGR